MEDQRMPHYSFSRVDKYLYYLYLILRILKQGTPDEQAYIHTVILMKYKRLQLLSYFGKNTEEMEKTCNKIQDIGDIPNERGDRLTEALGDSYCNNTTIKKNELSGG